MRRRIIWIIIIMQFMCGIIYADEHKVKGVEVVTDTAASVVSKANALLSGNLEITMSQDRSKYDRSNYTINAMGQRVPKSTVTKSGAALHRQ